MNKFVIAAGLSAFLATGAVAGGYTSSVVEVEPVAVVTAPQFSWSGAYVGGTVARTAVDLDFAEDFEFESRDDTATTYGVVAGYRHQFENNFVLGGELGYQKTESLFESGGAETYTAEAQAGYAFNRVLPYISAGYAKVDGEDSSTYGVGIDYAVTDNLVVGGKYSRTDLGNSGFNQNVFEGAEGFTADVETVGVRAIYKF